MSKLAFGPDLREFLRSKLKQVDDSADRGAPLRGDFDLNPHMPTREERKLRPAAVLVPIIERREGATVLFTKRADTLQAHAGQVSFPGGRIDEGDGGAIAAALRETQEEISLGRDFIDVVGFLDHYETGTGFAITPVVSVVREGFTLKANSREVAEIFETPLDFLMNPANHERHSREYQGRTRHFYAMPYNGQYIWGATAGMLVNLYDRLTRS
jgi:8-oxo-dGTP pyrophosphatase MutT (NUDIX family)